MDGVRRNSGLTIPVPIVANVAFGGCRGCGTPPRAWVYHGRLGPVLRLFGDRRLNVRGTLVGKGAEPAHRKSCNQLSLAHLPREDFASAQAFVPQPFLDRAYHLLERSCPNSPQRLHQAFRSRIRTGRDDVAHVLAPQLRILRPETPHDRLDMRHRPPGQNDEPGPECEIPRQGFHRQGPHSTQNEPVTRQEDQCGTRRCDHLADAVWQ